VFLTRFVTHFCAPTFVFLAGASAYLHGKKLGDRRALARFLLTRGAWLILLDIIVVSPVWGLELGVIDLATLWAIGFSMMMLAGLVFLPPSGALAVSAVILLGHNLLDHVHAVEFGALAPLWIMLHEPGALPFGLHGGVAYPVLPWFGIMAVGYGLGPSFWKLPRSAGGCSPCSGLRRLCFSCCCVELTSMVTRAPGSGKATV
jgi:uncharacterized membrane protein